MPRRIRSSPKPTKSGAERKPYTLTPEAIEQRRTAALSRAHGKRVAASGSAPVVDSATTLTDGPSGPTVSPRQSSGVEPPPFAPALGQRAGIEPALTADSNTGWCGECGRTDDGHDSYCSRSDAFARQPEPEAPPEALTIPTLPQSSVTVTPAPSGLFAKALDAGRPEILNPLTAPALEALSALGDAELDRLLVEGLAIDSLVLGPEGPMTFPVGAKSPDGRDLSGQVITERKTNPRAANALKVLEMLGRTADAQALTPKAAGERERDNSIAGMCAQIVAARERLGIPGRA